MRKCENVKIMVEWASQEAMVSAGSVKVYSGIGDRQINEGLLSCFF